jgi:hypothetical protein
MHGYLGVLAQVGDGQLVANVTRDGATEVAVSKEILLEGVR